MIYEYACAGCRKLFEVIAKLDDSRPDKCPMCGHPKVERIMSIVNNKVTGYSDRNSYGLKPVGNSGNTD